MAKLDAAINATRNVLSKWRQLDDILKSSYLYSYIFNKFEILLVSVREKRQNEPIYVALFDGDATYCKSV